MAALIDRLIPGVFVSVTECWVTLAYAGRRTYSHLPLQMLRYTFRMGRTPLLLPITFRIELPAELVQRSRRGPRKRAV